MIAPDENIWTPPEYENQGEVQLRHEKRNDGDSESDSDSNVESICSVSLIGNPCHPDLVTFLMRWESNNRYLSNSIISTFRVKHWILWSLWNSYGADDKNMHNQFDTYSELKNIYLGVELVRTLASNNLFWEYIVD